MLVSVDRKGCWLCRPGYAWLVFLRMTFLDVNPFLCTFNTKRWLIPTSYSRSLLSMKTAITYLHETNKIRFIVHCFWHFAFCSSSMHVSDVSSSIQWSGVSFPAILIQSLLIRISGIHHLDHSQNSSWKRMLNVHLYNKWMIQLTLP